MKTSGNTVLVTGGASGIGLALATRLVALGNTVIITGRRAEKLAEARARVPGLETIVSDVSAASAIEELHAQVLERFPATNVLINNAGIMKLLDLHVAPFETIGEEIETNLLGSIRMVQRFLPHLKSKESAAIVNVSSGLAFVPLPLSPVYCAAKAGVHSYTQSLRVQLAATNIKVFELAPPATQTEMLDAFSGINMEGSKVSTLDEVVETTIKAFANNTYEIRPGQSNLLKTMSRLAPGFALKMMGKSVPQLLARSALPPAANAGSKHAGQPVG